MITEYTEQGYWLSSGSYRGWKILAEGETRAEARRGWVYIAAEIRDGRIGVGRNV